MRKINLELDLINTMFFNNIESKEELTENLKIINYRLTNLLSKMHDEELIEIDDNYYLEFDEEEKNILFDTIELIEKVIKGVEE